MDDARAAQVLTRERRGRVEVLTLNRPAKLNALSVELIDALMAAFDDAELDDDIGAVVLTGAGRAFSAGADIAGFAPHMLAGAQAAIRHFMRPGQQLTRRIESFPKPVLAAVNGLAYGGGCEIVATHIALAQQLAEKPAATVAAALAAVHRGMDASIDDGLAIEEAAFARIVPTADAAEGVAAFLEKREPRYTGR